MATNKEKTIAACRELIYKYRNPWGKTFCDMYSCPLCKIHAKCVGCVGCPLADREGGSGCCKYTSYKNTEYAYYSILNARGYDLDFGVNVFPGSSGMPVPPEFERRARFFENLVPVLEKLPSEQFTKKGWKFLDIGYEK